MNKKTTKTWSNRLLDLFLVTAFLSMQWTPVHLHLSEQHDHDGSHHQHQVETHAHNLTEQAIAADFSHQTSHANIIVLAQECSFTRHEKQDNLATALVAEATSISQPFLPVSIALPEITTTKSSYFDISTTHPRAPPLVS